MKLQDLKRGMRCTRRNGEIFMVEDVDNGTIFYLFPEEEFGTKTLKEDLAHESFSSLDVIKVDDITLDGYKTIWEREDKKYYLKIPEVYGGEYYLNYRIEEDSFYLSNKDELGGFYKTKFTEEEIYNLPRQNFIQGLEKELVK